MAAILGIEIGGTKLQIVSGEEQGKILHRWRAIADRAGGGPAICRQLLDGVAAMRKRVEPQAIGIGFGGPVDHQTGRISRSHQIAGWEGFELRDWLIRESRLPTVVENDSNLAALAEAKVGAGAGTSPMFYFNLGSGVGGGLVIDGRIYHGLPPGEAEFGHLRIDRSGATVESRCSGWAIDTRIHQLQSSDPTSVLAHATGGMSQGESKHLAAALQQRDPAAQRILRELADDLAFALSHVVHLIHPAVIVMGGGLALVGEPLRAAIADALPHYIMKVFAPGPPINLAKLGEDAVPTGALLLAAEACLP